MAASGVGFTNLGASCFISAGLQVIFSVPRLCQAIETGTSETEQALQTVLGLVRHAQGRVMPKPITDMFYEGRQQDAGEFILGVLADCGAAHHLLGGEEAPRFRCQHCNYTRPLRMERFLSLQVPLMAATPARSVQQALDAYLAAEHAQADVQNWCCLNFDCLDAGRACDDPLHTTNISVWPEVLLLFLKRWDAAHGLLNHQVHCNDILTAGAHRYKLQSLATHIGPIPTSGHYVAYCRCNSGFLRMDDDKVRIVAADATESFAIVPDEKVYVALYVKYIPSSEEEDPEHLGDSPRPPAVKRPAIDLDSDSDLLNNENPDFDIDSDVLPVSDEHPNIPAASKMTTAGNGEASAGVTNVPDPKHRARAVIDLTDSEHSSDGAVPTVPPSLPQQDERTVKPKRLQNFAEYTAEERQQIAETLRNSTTLENAIAQLQQALSQFTARDKSSSTYLSRRLLKNWFNNHHALQKALTSCASATKPQPSSFKARFGTARAALDDETLRIVEVALQNSQTAAELERLLADALPGFSATDRTAEHYIARGTLYSWHMRKDPASNPSPKLPATWHEEHQQNFAIACQLPAQRPAASVAANDTSGQWLLRDSWTFCARCGRRRPRAKTPSLAKACNPAVMCVPVCDHDARDLLAPPQTKLTVINKLEGYIMPAFTHWQPWAAYIRSGEVSLAGLLSHDDLHTLAVLDIKIEFRTRRGGNAAISSKQKRTVVRARWRSCSLMTAVRSNEASRAFQWLLANNSTYAEYAQQHENLLTDNHQDESWREAPTAKLLLQMPGIEIAARPWLYPIESYADTDIAKRLTTLGWISSSQKPSTRASFFRKMNSRCIDYVRDFPLQCLMYDVCMAKTISSVLNIANQKQTAPEQIACGMDMFEGYWHQQLRKMEDICRQEFETSGNMSDALPSVFFTVAPAEWKYTLPDGVFFDDSLSNQQALLTMHLHHTLASLLEIHLLKEGRSLKEIGIAKIRQWSFRFEFQSRGTLHLHAVLWADLMENWTANDLCGRSNSDKSSPFLRLLERLFNSRADVQCGDGTHVLLKYVAGYLAKASDALQFQAKQAQHAGKLGGEWRQTYRLLSKRSPMEQEMTMEFAGLPMVKHSFSGLAIFAPIPGSTAKNDSRHHYEAYQHYLSASKDTFGCSRDLTYIQWLRKYRLADTEHGKYSVLARNLAGPAAGKACGVAITFPFELLDIYVGAWAASCLKNVAEIRLDPHIADVNKYPSSHANELARRNSFEAPEGCRHLKAVLCLDEFQLEHAREDHFEPDVGKLLAQMETELLFRGLNQDRVATFKARLHACTFLLKKIYSGEEDAGLWNARRVPHLPARQWSAEQETVLNYIRKGTCVSDAAETEAGSRILQVSGGPGTGKTEVVIAAAKAALDDGCRVLIAGPIGLLVSMYRQVFQKNMSTVFAFLFHTLLAAGCACQPTTT